VLTSDELAILIVISQKNALGTNRPAVGREYPKREPLVVDGVRIPMIAEWYTGSPPNLGMVAHKLCHLLLHTPDLDMAGKPWPFAAGDYSIMDHSGITAHLDPFAKMKLGWVPYSVVTKTGTYSLRDVERQGKILVLYDPYRGPGKYFLVENRWRGNSYDAGVPRGGRGIGDEGVAVWHILEDPSLFGKVTPPVGGPREWGRRGIRLIRANGGTPADDRCALLSEEGIVLSDETEPAHLRWLDGSKSGFGIELLTTPGPEVRVDITIRREVGGRGQR
jgi:hypothetical protein